MTMKPQILLCALLTAAAHGGTTEEVNDKPYYIFRNVDCKGAQEHTVDENEEGGKTTSGDGVYANPSSWSGAATGYMPYPSHGNRRQRALIMGVERDIWGGSSSGSGSGSRSGKDDVYGSPSQWGGSGYLFSKCNKNGGRTWSKSSKSKSSKSKSGKSDSSKSSTSPQSDSSKSSKSSSLDSPPTPVFHVHPSPPSTPTGPTPQYKPYTAKPTQKPAVASSCEALSEGDVVYTSNYAKLKYTYEAAVSEDAEVESVAESLDKSLTLYVGNELMDCDEDRRRQLLQPQSRRFLGELEIVGIEQDSPEISDDECSYFTGDNEIDDTDCYVVNSGMWLYLQNEEGDEWRRRLSPSEDEEFMEESTAGALELIMEAMNEEDPSPFVEDSDEKYSVSGLMGVWFISGTTFNGETIEAENKEEEDDGRGGQIDGIQDGGQPIIKTSKMNAVGTSLLTIGLVALLALAVMLVVRKRQQTPAGEKYDSFDDDNENDLDDGHTDMDAQSLKSSMPPTPNRLGRAAYVVGEEGSIYTSATHDTRVLHLHDSAEFGNGNDDDQQVDVHHCTSAMCQICNGKETMFVSAVDEDDRNTEIPVEEYEMGYDPSATMKQSFAYEPKEDVSTPSFENPSEIERPYVVDDTIDF